MAGNAVIALGELGGEVRWSRSEIGGATHHRWLGFAEKKTAGSLDPAGQPALYG
jgi:hypothetical protein